jgi:3-deoxy-7-phosphoheptulonate synthase
MSLAAVAAGADALMLEVHPDPEAALSDGDQSLKPKRFADLMDGLRRVAEAVGRTIAEPDSMNALPANGREQSAVLV